MVFFFLIFSPPPIYNSSSCRRDSAVSIITVKYTGKRKAKRKKKKTKKIRNYSPVKTKKKNTKTVRIRWDRTPPPSDNFCRTFLFVFLLKLYFIFPAVRAAAVSVRSQSGEFFGNRRRPSSATTTISTDASAPKTTTTIEMIISKDLFLLGDQDYLRLPKDDKRPRKNGIRWASLQLYYISFV